MKARAGRSSGGHYERFSSFGSPIVSNMNLKHLCSLRLAALLAVLTLAADRLEAAIPPAENLLPADTFLVVTAPDCAAARKAMTESPQMMLWNDPTMRPFHDRFVSKWNELFAGPLESALGVNLATFMDIPQGQLTLAVTRNGWDGVDDTQSVGWLLLLDARDQADLLKKTVAGLQKKWADSGKAIRTETVHGLAFSIVPLSTNDIPAAVTGLVPSSPQVQELGQTTKAAKPLQMVIGQFQSLLIVGNSIKAVEPVVARLTGGSAPCLADNSLFAEDKAAQFRNSPIYYSWLNARGLFDVIAHIPAAEPNPNAPSLFPVMSPAMVLNSAGLMGLKSVSLAYHQTREGTTATLFLSAPEATRQGLLKMLATPPKDAAPPAFVPADALKYWRWRLDGQKIWAELQKSLSAISPSIASSVNAFIDMANSLAQQKNPSFDLRKNLIANLGDDWMGFERAPAGATAEALNQTHGIFLFAAANPEQTLVAIKTTAALYAPQENAPAPQDFLGHTIHAVALRPQMAPSGATAAQTLFCTIGSGYIAMSPDISVLQDFLRSAGKPPRPLTQAVGLADAVQHIGGMGNGLFGYQDNRVVMRAAFNSLKQSAAGSLAGQPTLALMPKSLVDMLDYSLLPDYDQVAKYFYFSVFTGTTTPEGITFKGFYPRPPQLK